MKLKNTRVQITRQGKAMRVEALKFQKDVIAIEKEFIELIEPVERELEAKQKVIDEEKTKIRRKELLPERKEKLARIDIEVEDDFLLLMDDNRFDEFYNTKNAEHLEAKELKAKERQEERERAMRVEQDKMAERERKLEEEKRIEEAKKKAEEEARAKAIKDTELAKLNAEKEAEEAKAKAEKEKADAIKAEQEKAKQEKEALIAEQKRKEEEKIKAEKEAKQFEAEQIAEEKVQKFLKDNGWSEKNKNDFIIVNEPNKVVLFKKVGELELEEENVEE